MRFYLVLITFAAIINISPSFANLCENQGGVQNGFVRGKFKELGDPKCTCNDIVFNPETHRCEANEIYEDPSLLSQVERIITDEMDEDKRADLIGAVSAVSVPKREAVVTQALRLISDGVVGDSCADLISAISAVSGPKRKSVVTQALRLISDDMGGDERADLMDAVLAVSASDRDSVIVHAWKLITDKIERYNRACVVRAISGLPEEEREALVVQIQRVTDGMEMDGYHRVQIIREVSILPEEEREARVERVLDERDEHEGQQTVSRILQILGMPLGQPLSVRGAQMPHTEGTNVLLFNPQRMN